jgi:hypothetical protein
LALFLFTKLQQGLLQILDPGPVLGNPPSAELTRVQVLADRSILKSAQRMQFNGFVIDVTTNVISAAAESFSPFEMPP